MLILTLIIAQVCTIAAKTLDNRLIDQPVVTCGPDAIRIRGQSEEVFEGQIFIKNQRRSPDCFVVYSADENSTTPEFSLSLKRLSSCGIDIRRNAARGLELFSVFVFAFHPSFVTAGDRAFAVNCLFQQEQITVSTRFDFISDITPKAVLGVASAKPSVELTIVEGQLPTGEKAANPIVVGQPLMLIWSIGEMSALYGLRILDCTAETSDRRGMAIIHDGCSTDSSLVSDIRYSDNHQRAFADAIAFKFPDLSDVYFRCIVKLCIRRFDHLLLTGKSEEDLCSSVYKCGQKKNRLRRRASYTDIKDDDGAIVVTGRMSVNDHAVLHEYAAQMSSDVAHTICYPKELVALGSAFSATICVSMLVVATSVLYTRISSYCRN